MIERSAVRSIANLVFGIIELLIGLRIILKLFSANPQTPFVDFVYSTSHQLLTPFLGMFPSPTRHGSVLEISALFALLVYGFIGYIVEELLDSLARKEHERSSSVRPSKKRRIIEEEEE